MAYATQSDQSDPGGLWQAAAAVCEAPAVLAAAWWLACADALVPQRRHNDVASPSQADDTLHLEEEACLFA